jgi:hypothetical protein
LGIHECRRLASVILPELSKHRERFGAQWGYFSGTPGSIAQIARAAYAATGPQRTDVTIIVRSPGKEREYASDDDFLADVRVDELPRVGYVAVAANNPSNAQHIEVTLTRRSETAGGAVVLSVSGEDSEWVTKAGDDMSRLIDAMCPRVRWVYGVVGGFVALISLGIARQLVDSPYREIVIALGVVGAAAFVLGVFNSIVTPVFELLPDGKPTRRRRALYAARRVARWVGSEAVAAIIGGVAIVLAVAAFSRLW